jgi:hypothetical protein
MTPLDLLAQPERFYFLKGVVSRGELSVWWGPPKCGKSFLLMHVAYALSQGRSVFGRRTRPARVLYIACEGKSGLRGRIEALVEQHGLSEGFLAIAQAVDLFNEGDTDTIVAIVLRDRVDILVVDTLNRVMGGGDENSSADLGLVIYNVDRIRAETGAHVAIVHHGTKNGTGGPRGHGSLAGAADALIEVTKAEDGTRTATLQNAKDDPSDQAMRFLLRAVDLGTDDDGDQRTTCVVEEIEAGIRLDVRLPRLAAGSRTALELLERAIILEGVPAPASQHIPADVRVVRTSTWRAYCYDGRVDGSDSSAARQKAFKRATDDLQDKRRIGAWNGWVWVADRQDRPDMSSDVRSVL